MTRRLIYQVAVGPQSNLYDYCTASVAEYAEAHGIDYHQQTEPILRINPDPKTSGRSEGASRLGYLPIYEKENALAHLVDYDQVAVIDADVWIRPGSPNVFDELRVYDDFAGVVERSLPMTQKYRDKLRNYSPSQYGRLPDVNWHVLDGIAQFINMGVMVMSNSVAEYLRGQSPREFLARPEFKRFVDGLGAWRFSTDQTLMNWWIRKEKMRVHALNWRWNALYGALLPGKVEEAHFVHFFLRDYLPHKGERVEELPV